MGSKEKTYYEPVEKFLKNELGCFVTRQQQGSRKYVGIVDVLGVRDLGGQYSNDIEVIAVEVKTNKGSFGKSLGQALGYSLLAHKCYLAIPLESKDKFTLEEKEMANRLGVGLIEIHSDETCKEVLTPKYHQPIDTLMLRTLHELYYIRCSLCGTLTHIPTFETGDIKAAVGAGQAFYFRKPLMDSDEDYKPTKRREILFPTSDFRGRRVLVCGDCIKNLKLNKI